MSSISLATASPKVPAQCLFIPYINTQLYGIFKIKRI